jgi:hypothetical protein
VISSKYPGWNDVPRWRGIKEGICDPSFFFFLFLFFFSLQY